MQLIIPEFYSLFSYIYLQATGTESPHKMNIAEQTVSYVSCCIWLLELGLSNATYDKNIRTIYFH